MVGVGIAPTASAATSGTAPVQPNSPDFSEVLASLATSAIQDVRTGEAAAISGITGNASAQEVVSAVMAAEQSLQMAVAVRDKVVAAYQEVSRMAI